MVDRYLLRFYSAVLSTSAELPATPSTSYLYPRGDLIRLQVPYLPRLPRLSLGSSTLCDPLSLVWLADTGEYRNVLQAVSLGPRLGLRPDDAYDLLQAADRPFASLTEAQVVWRAGLLRVLAACYPAKMPVSRSDLSL